MSYAICATENLSYPDGMDGNISEFRTGIIDYFEVGGRPAVMERSSGRLWIWTTDHWDSTTVAADASSQSITQEDFVHRFPFAALALLDI